MNFVRIGLTAALAMAGGSLMAQPGFDFMPDGGRETLLHLAREGKLDLRSVAVQTKTDRDWSRELEKSDPSLSDVAIKTLAGYLAVNMPMTGEALNDPLSALPPDGKELALNNCQSCHSLFSGYLTQERDVEGWRGTFKSPFHKEIAMSEKERETFARYSAINMPIPYDEVPEELRF